MTDDEPGVTQLVELDEALRAGGPDARSTDIGPAVGTLRALDALRPRPPAPPPAGRLGRFRLDRELGRGGFGVVFLAHDPALGRAVALKVPFPHVLSEPALLERFRREARAAARLAHPHIVPVHEVGDDPPAVFLASEYVAGGTLANRLLAGPLSPRAAAELVASLADAVAYAHARGVVHRDIKPANVLLGDADTPRLTDFGLAAVADIGGAALTRTGTAMGTPSYMPPEQARGRADRIGPAADVYSLGAVLYECLTGRPPFAGETELDTLRQVLDHDPPPPRLIRPGVPRDLETVALRCLAKEPAGRYRTAEDLAADLRRFLAGEPVWARPVGLVGRFVRRCRRRPVVAALGFGLAGAVAAGVGGVVSEYRRAERERADAETRRGEAVAALERTDQLLTHSRASLDEMTRLGQELTCQHNSRELGRQILEVARGHYGRVLAVGEDAQLRRQAMGVCRRMAAVDAGTGRLETAADRLVEVVTHAEVLDATGQLDLAARFDLIRACVVDYNSLVHRGGPRDRRGWFLDRAANHLAVYRAASPTHPLAATWQVTLWSQRAAVAGDAGDDVAAAAAYDAGAAQVRSYPPGLRSHTHTALLALFEARGAVARLAAGQTDEAARLAEQAVADARQVPPAERMPAHATMVLAESLAASVRVAAARGDAVSLVGHLAELAETAERYVESVTTDELPELVPIYLSSYHTVTAARVVGLDALGRPDEATAVLADAVAVRPGKTVGGPVCRPRLHNAAHLIERLTAAGQTVAARRATEAAAPLTADHPHPAAADAAALARLRAAVAAVSADAGAR